MRCRDKEIQLACFKPSDGSDSVTVKHVTLFDEKGVNIAQYYSDDSGVTIDPASYLGGGVLTLGACCDGCIKEYEVYVVRLDGSKTGTSNAIIEADGLAAGDIGNTFTLGGAGPFPEYVSYTTQWLGDSMQDAILDWNSISYLAGIGSGSAAYYHAMLPALTDASEQECHKQEITLTANAGAYVEFRFKVLK